MAQNVIVPRILAFSYPGGKANLAPTIVRMFHPSCHRLVDVFCGRGNVTWAAMYEHEHGLQYWMNCLGTSDFMHSLKGYLLKDLFLQAAGRSPIPPNPAREYYDKLRSQVSYAKRYPATSEGIKRFLDHSEAKLMEGFVTFQGGTYRDPGGSVNPRLGSGVKGHGGGVSPKGWRNKCLLAYDYLHEYDPKITALDWRKVLANCGPSDMVYL